MMSLFFKIRKDQWPERSTEQDTREGIKNILEGNKVGFFYKEGDDMLLIFVYGADNKDKEYVVEALLVDFGFHIFGKQYVDYLYDIPQIF